MKAEPQDKSYYDIGADFASSLNARVEELKFGATIGSIASSNNEYCLFLGHNHHTLFSEELKESLPSILYDSQISVVIEVVAASKYKEANTTILSKLI